MESTASTCCIVVLIFSHLQSGAAQVNSTPVAFLPTTSKGITIESEVLGPLRVWHLVFISCTLVLTAVTVACCCVDTRIPRTKQEIEERHRKRKLNAQYVTYLDQLPEKVAEGGAQAFEPKEEKDTQGKAPPENTNRRQKQTVAPEQAGRAGKAGKTKGKQLNNSTPLAMNPGDIINMMQKKTRGDAPTRPGSAAMAKWMSALPSQRGDPEK